MKINPKPKIVAPIAIADGMAKIRIVTFRLRRIAITVATNPRRYKFAWVPGQVVSMNWLKVSHIYKICRATYIVRVLSCEKNVNTAESNLSDEKKCIDRMSKVRLRHLK